MQPISVIPRLAVALATGLLVAWAFAPGASAQLQPGDILVVDPDAPPVSTAVLFQVDPQSGARTVLSNFGAGSPSAVAIEADGDILITDTAAGTDPTGGTSEWGVLYRLSRDPVTGALIRTVLTDFGVGADTGRNPRAVAVEADGQILVTTGRPGTLNDKPLLVRVDPVTGARAILSDFRDSSQGGVGIEPRGIAIEAGGAILVIDAQGGPNALGELFRINPQTGFRTSVSRFNTPILGTTPTSVAVEVTGQILVTDEGHLTTPLGLLFRIDPQSGLRTVLSDFNTGANTGREPAGVAIEADGQILVVDRHAGPLTQGMLFRVDPQTGARTIVSDFAIGPNGGAEPLALAVVQPTQGELIVVNEVVNDNGGTAVASDWTMSVNGTNPDPASFPGSSFGQRVLLDPGAYNVSANGPAGYTISVSPDCAGTIAAREDKPCTVTLNDQPATLVLIMNVVNDNGGTLTASNFSPIVYVNGGPPSFFVGEGPPGRSITIDPGTYSVGIARQDDDGSYAYGFGPDCADRTIAVGETQTCTITANDVPYGRMTIVTEVVNDNGGTAVASDWTMSVNGTNPDPASFPGSSFGQRVLLDPGAYNVSANGPAGYTISVSPDCAGTIAAREDKPCTVTLNDQPPGTSICDGKIATIVAAPGQSLIQGTPGNDVIVALVGSHTVRGRDGNDSICTGTDFDLIEGGPGDDTILDAGGVKNTVRGDADRDTIITGDGTDRIDGGSGNDTISSGGGDDWVDGQGGDDIIGTAAGNDRVEGGLGHDTITTGDGNDRIEAGSGNDAVHAGEGANRVDGQGDADTIATGAGDDEIDGGTGGDTFADSGGRNMIQGGDGNDVITTGDAADEIRGGGGNDLIDAGGGNNSVYGDFGDDTILAGGGDDLIDGGNGFDACTPGGGVNTIWRCEVMT